MRHEILLVPDEHDLVGAAIRQIHLCTCPTHEPTVRISQIFDPTVPIPGYLADSAPDPDHQGDGSDPERIHEEYERR